MQFVSPKEWQRDIEPIVESWAESAGTRWRRHRAILGPWVLEYIGDDVATYEWFSKHWKTAPPGEHPDAYCYHLRQIPANFQNADRLPATTTDHQPPEAEHRLPATPLPRCVLCIESGRALVCGPARYSAVNQTCEALMTAVAARCTRVPKAQAGRRPPGTWWLLRACCVEYQTERGDCRSVALLGRSGAEVSAQGYALALCKPGNGFLSDGLTCIRIDSRTAVGAKSRLLWPSRLVAAFRQLLPYLATSPFEGVEIDADIAAALRNHRDAADLTRAIDDGSFAETMCKRLTDQLAGAGDACSLVDPRQLLGTDRCLEQSQLSDLIHCSLDPADAFILRQVLRTDFVARTTQDIAGMDGRFARAAAEMHHAHIDKLIDMFGIRPVFLNMRLSIPQTQFCLRHFLENRSDSVELLFPGSACDPALLRAMQLEERTCGAASDSGGTERCFVHGPRRVNLVAFHLDGRRTEMVAFDPSVDGYAQVCSVWPGQVADFFSRHDGLRVRELFTEINGDPADTKTPSPIQ